MKLNFPSVTAVLTLVQTKQIRKTHINERIKNIVQTIQNTVYTSTLITKTPTQLSKHPTYSDPHIIKQVQTTIVQDTQDITLKHLRSHRICGWSYTVRN